MPTNTAQGARDQRQNSYGPDGETTQQKKSADRNHRSGEAWSVARIAGVSIHTAAIGSVRGRWC